MYQILIRRISNRKQSSSKGLWDITLLSIKEVDYACIKIDSSDKSGS